MTQSKLISLSLSVLKDSNIYHRHVFRLNELMYVEFSTVPDTHCKSIVSVNYFKTCCFSERVVFADRELKGIDQSHSFLFSLNSVFLL